MVLLYSPSGVFGYAIAVFDIKRVLKHGMAISHVEVYKGGGYSYASRDGIGVDTYPLRTSNIACVLESTIPLDMGDMASGFQAKLGHKYDNATIVSHVTKGLTEGNHLEEVCSEVAAYLMRCAGNFKLFGNKKPDQVKPIDFLDEVDSGLLKKIWPNV